MTDEVLAAIFIGYHSGTTYPEGVRAHTMSSANLAGVALNGVDHNETGLNAATTLEMTYKNYRPAQVAALMPGIERDDAHSIRYTGPSIIEVAHVLAFLTNYEPGLTP